MAYPSLEKYQEALQSPALVFVDPELKTGTVDVSGLGMPLALCGGFALTYRVVCKTGRYAVRCFHKEVPDLERRYRLISDQLAQLNSKYFMPFTFVPQGIRVDGSLYPIVKMAWAEGDTLGDFLDREHSRPSALECLRGALQNLAAYLAGVGIAHGDIQPGNIMVSDGGRTVRLIDYDGMFVDRLRGQTATEFGQVNFQHPQRTPKNFDERLDRFAFVVLDLALQSLIAVRGLWQQSHSDQDGIVFRAADYRSPASSKTLALLAQQPSIASAVKDLAAISASPIDAVPTLPDFLARRNIPSIIVVLGRPTAGAVEAAYQGAFPVLNADDYGACLLHVGDKIELVGRIVEVSRQKTKRGAPYVFVNFAPWKGNAVKLTIWSDGLKILTKVPDASWVGRWVSVTGLMEPPFSSRKYGYSHLSITINHANQIRELSEGEAVHRRSSKPVSRPQNRNAEIVSRMGAASISSKPSAPAAPPVTPPLTPNQQVIQAMRKSSPSTSPQPSHSQRRPSYTPQRSSSPASLLDRAISWLRQLF